MFFVFVLLINAATLHRGTRHFFICMPHKLEIMHLTIKRQNNKLQKKCQKKNEKKRKKKKERKYSLRWLGDK